MRTEDRKQMSDAVQGVLDLLKERGLSNDPRAKVLRQALDDMNRITDLRKAAAAAASARS